MESWNYYDRQCKKAFLTGEKYMYSKLTGCFHQKSKTKFEFNQVVDLLLFFGKNNTIG